MRRLALPAAVLVALAVVAALAAWFLGDAPPVEPAARAPGAATASAPDAVALRAVDAAAGKPDRSASAPATRTPAPATSAAESGADSGRTPSPSLRIRAVDALTREPLAGARVSLTLRDEHQVLRTGPDGWIEAGGPQLRGAVRILVRSPGHAMERVTLRPPAQQEVPLRPFRSLRGVVVDRDTGAVVADALVRQTDPGGPGVRSDARGLFELRRIAYGRSVKLEVRADDYPRQSVTLDGRKRGLQEVAVQRTELLVGTVHDASSGEPVSGAVVRAGDGSTRTDEAGRFELDVLTDLGEVVVNVQSNDHCELEATVQPSPRGVDLPLVRHATLTGVLHDGQTFLAGATVRASDLTVVPADDDRSRFEIPANAVLMGPDRTLRANARASRRVKTDAEGRFTIEGLVPSVERAVLRVQHPGLGIRQFAVAVDVAPGGTVHVDLYPGCPEERAAANAVDDARGLMCTY